MSLSNITLRSKRGIASIYNSENVDNLKSSGSLISINDIKDVDSISDPNSITTSKSITNDQEHKESVYGSTKIIDNNHVIPIDTTAKKESRLSRNLRQLVSNAKTISKQATKLSSMNNKQVRTNYQDNLTVNVNNTVPTSNQPSLNMNDTNNNHRDSMTLSPASLAKSIYNTYKSISVNSTTKANLDCNTPKKSLIPPSSDYKEHNENLVVNEIIMEGSDIDQVTSKVIARTSIDNDQSIITKRESMILKVKKIKRKLELKRVMNNVVTNISQISPLKVNNNISDGDKNYIDSYIDNNKVELHTSQTSSIDAMLVTNNTDEHKNIKASSSDLQPNLEENIRIKANSIHGDGHIKVNNTDEDIYSSTNNDIYKVSSSALEPYRSNNTDEDIHIKANSTDEDIYIKANSTDDDIYIKPYSPDVEPYISNKTEPCVSYNTDEGIHIKSNRTDEDIYIKANSSVQVNTTSSNLKDFIHIDASSTDELLQITNYGDEMKTSIRIDSPVSSSYDNTAGCNASININVLPTILNNNISSSVPKLNNNINSSVPTLNNNINSTVPTHNNNISSEPLLNNNINCSKPSRMLANHEDHILLNDIHVVNDNRNNNFNYSRTFLDRDFIYDLDVEIITNYCDQRIEDSLKSLSVVKAEHLPHKVASLDITNILIESDGNKNEEPIYYRDDLKAVQASMIDPEKDAKPLALIRFIHLLIRYTPSLKLKQYLISLKTYIVKWASAIHFILLSLYIIFEILLELGFELYEIFKPYRIDLLLSAFAGFIMCFFGGFFVTTIAAVEAYRLCGYDSTMKCLHDLSEEFNTILEISRKELGGDITKYIESPDYQLKQINKRINKHEIATITDEIDSISTLLHTSISTPVNKNRSTSTFHHRNSSTSPSLQEFQREQELVVPDTMASKALYFLHHVDPLKFSDAVIGINAGFIAVMATLKLQFAKTVTLASSMSKATELHTKPLLLPIIKLLLPKVYRKWSEVLLSYTIKSIALSVAWTLRRVISSYHSAIRGGLLCSKHIILYLVAFKWIQSTQSNEKTNLNKSKHSSNIEVNNQKIIEDEDNGSNCVYILFLERIIGYSLAIGGIYFQLSYGFALPFPLNVILFPITLIEYALVWMINNSSSYFSTV